MLGVSANNVRDIQDAIQANGEPVEFTPAGGAPVTVKARCRQTSSGELANAIDDAQLFVTFDAREFATRAPERGDAVRVQGTRRAIVSVRQVTAAGMLISYQCGVQG